MIGKVISVFIIGITVATLSWANAADAQEKVRIAYASNSLAFLVPFVAQDRGLYRKHGLDVEMIQVRPNVARGTESASTRVSRPGISGRGSRRTSDIGSSVSAVM